jgi:hypothetical protein
MRTGVADGTAIEEMTEKTEQKDSTGRPFNDELNLEKAHRDI